MSHPTRTENVPGAHLMLIDTTDGVRVAGAQDTLISLDVREIAQFLQRNSTTAGFTTQYAINRTTGLIISWTRKGRATQREVRALLEQGFDEWTYSACWAPSKFRAPDGRTIPVRRDLNLLTEADVAPWRRAFGQ